MSPSSQFHAKKEIASTTTNNNGLLPPPLKINKGSHFIKKSSSSSSPPSSSSSSSTSSTSSSLVNTMMTPATACASNKPPQRHPVIIYTHSPKIIHTHPRDFMALVQKLTGLSRSDEDGGGNNGNLPPLPHQPKQEPGSSISVASRAAADKDRDVKKLMVGNEDNETSSVITEENNCCSSMGENQVNSCFVLPIVEPPMNPYMANLPVFTASSTAEFMCSSHQPLLNYSDSLFFSHNMRTSIASSASLEGMNEFREY